MRGVFAGFRRRVRGVHLLSPARQPAQLLLRPAGQTQRLQPTSDVLSVLLLLQPPSFRLLRVSWNHVLETLWTKTQTFAWSLFTTTRRWVPSVLSVMFRWTVPLWVCVVMFAAGGLRERSGRPLTPDGADPQSPRRLLFQPHLLSAGGAAVLHDQRWHGTRRSPQLPVSPRNLKEGFFWSLNL